MPHVIDTSILRILGSKGQTVGTGFLVAERVAVTCFHVVLSAGIDDENRIRVRFMGENQPIFAKVLNEDINRDVAVLELDEIPAGIRPLRLGHASESDFKNDLYTFGYATAAGEQGIGGLGTFIRQNGDFVQFRMHEANHGHSGAPLYDQERGVVIGMIKKGEDAQGRNAETTYAISAETIWQICPELESSLSINESLISKNINSLSYFQSFGNKISRNCVFITPDLIRKKDKTTQNIVVGKTINLKHLVDNSFMERLENINDALEKLDQHIQVTHSTDNSQLVTFWIDGKSGSGKSVLLLQILQKIVLERNAKVFWLANEFSLLEKMLIEWADARLTFDEPVYIFIDDFNSPQNRDTFDHQSIVQVITDIRNQDVQWPIIVTCSPPEYLDEFRASGRDEAFLVEQWTIPLMNRLEQAALLEWFTSRTGELYKTGLAFEEEEGLIVSMIFELRYGDMKEFGRRFKMRLDSSGLTEIMAQPLALNRLYIWPPKLWFSELSLEQKEALAVLNAGSDFLFISTDLQGDGYVRLTHPHLSDVIYKSIRPQSGGIVRADDLANAFERAFRFKDVLASKILFAVSIGGERLEDLDNHYLARRMADIWMQYESYVWENHAIGVPFFWVNWTRWAARDSQIKTLFTPIIPIDKAIDLIGYSHTHWGDIWLQLWACEPNYARLVESALIWLERSERYYSQEKGYLVWYTLLSSPSIKMQTKVFLQLLDIGIRKLDDFNNNRWAAIWQALLGHKESLPVSIVQDLVVRGIKWLAGHQGFFQWSFVWQVLLQQQSNLPVGTTLTDLLNMGIHWLKNQEHMGQWSFVWQVLLKQQDNSYDAITRTDLLGAGIRWLKGREHLQQWSFVWEELLSEKNSEKLPPDTTLNDMLNIGIDWLIQSDQNQVQWPFVWQGVVAHWELLSPKLQTQIINQGLSWLKSQNSSNSWPYMFESCLPKIQDYGQKISIISSAKLKFFKADVTSVEWYRLWSACILRWMYLDKEFQTEVLRQGLSSPQFKNDIFAWPSKFENRLLQIIGDRDHRNLILNWIDENPNSFTTIWLVLSLLDDRKIKHLKEQEIDYLTTWVKVKLFENDITNANWYSIWETYIKYWHKLNEELRAEVLNQSVNWLKTQTESDLWLVVFEKSLSYLIYNDDFLTIAINWIEMHPTLKKALILLLSLVKENQKYLPIESQNRLIVWTKIRLDKTSITSAEWRLVWEAYWELMPTLETANIALVWMKFNPRNTIDVEAIIDKLIVSGREDVHSLIMKWYAKNLEHPVGAIIKRHKPFGSEK